MFIPALVLLGVWSCEALRQLDAEAMFPYNDFTTARSDGYAVLSQSPSSMFAKDGHNLGDINGDGLDDLVFGQPQYGTGAHTVGDIDMAEFVSGDTTGLYIDGDEQDRHFGFSVDGGCDINGDGFQDVIIGSYHWYSTVTGIVAVLFGKASGYANLDANTLTSTNGFMLTIDTTNTRLGRQVGCLGHVNDDLYDDYFVSFYLTDVYDDAVLVLYGKETFGSTVRVEDEQPYSSEIANAYAAFDAGNHLGEDTTSTAFTFKDARTHSGSAFILQDFHSRYITQSPTTSPSSSPTVSPTSSPTTSSTVSPSESPTDSPSTSPSMFPTVSPSTSPTVSPTSNPTTSPTDAPSRNPTVSPSGAPSGSPTMTMSPTDTASPSMSPSMSPSVMPTHTPSRSPTSTPTDFPTSTPTSSPSAIPTSTPTTAPTEPQCEMSITTTGGDGLTWDLTDDEGDEEIASGEFGGEAMDFTLLASEEYLLFLSSDTVPAGTSITVSINGQDTVIPLEQGLTTSTEIAGVTCDAISNKIAAIDSAYSSTSVLLALLMAFM